MSSEICIAIGSKKEQLEKLIANVEILIKNDIEISESGKKFLSDFKFDEIETDFFILSIFRNNFEFDYEVMCVLRFMFSEANKLKISYQLYQVLNESGKTIEKNNMSILGKKFDLRLDQAFNKPILCSNCFKDQGLILDAFTIGMANNDICKNCKTSNGKKLNEKLLIDLTHRFFVNGTIEKAKYGAAPIIQFNEHHFEKSNVTFPSNLMKDAELIEKTLKIGFFYYGPRLWMIGENEPLKALHDKNKSAKIIKNVIEKYPTQQISTENTFFRLRLNPRDPSNNFEYDSSPKPGKNRLDSKNIPILYASQDLQVCIHECRVSVEDNLFVATLKPTKTLNFLDLTKILQEDNTEFESLDIALHMLFLAGKYSYKISRKISFYIHKAGLDGIIYPSYFSLLRTGSTSFPTVYGLSIRRLPPYLKQAQSQVIENVAIFGYPIKEGKIKVECINKMILRKVKYEYHFGPNK